MINTISLLSRPPQAKLLRLSVSNRCNLHCLFCCWDERKNLQHAPETTFSPSDYSFIANTAYESGLIRRCMLTGGEPLLIRNETLRELVSSISGVGFDKFWICTNGTMLGDRAQLLKDSGLSEVVVSLAARNEAEHQIYSNTCFPFSSIIAGLEKAAEAGINVRVDIPVFKGDGNSGVNDYPSFMELYRQVKSCGVKAIAFFPLHKTTENAGNFRTIYAPVNDINDGLQNDPLWSREETKEGQILMEDPDGFVVEIPAIPDPKNYGCRVKRCGSFCQGLYAIYIENEVLRFCHHIFADHSNEINVYEIVKNRDSQRLIDSFNTAVKWTQTR